MIHNDTKYTSLRDLFKVNMGAIGCFPSRRKGVDEFELRGRGVTVFFPSDLI